MVATPPKYKQSKYLRFVEEKGKERVSILEPVGVLIVVTSNLLTLSDADIIDYTHDGAVVFILCYVYMCCDDVILGVR